MVELDQAIASEQLNTEDLADAVIASVCGTKSCGGEAYHAVGKAAELAGACMPAEVIVAAWRAGRQGLAAELPGGLLVRICPERPDTIYLELRRSDAVLVIRTEPSAAASAPRMAFLHEIQSDAHQALAMLADLASIWGPPVGPAVRVPITH